MSTSTSARASARQFGIRVRREIVAVIFPLYEVCDCTAGR